MRLARVVLLLLPILLVAANHSRAGLDTEAAPPPATTLELIVVEAEGCIYCGMFRRDVLPSYQLSEQGKQMPVRFIDINALEAAHLELQGSVDIVPTFVVMKSRHEVGRIPGYVGPEDFFHSISYLLDAAP